MEQSGFKLLQKILFYRIQRFTYSCCYAGRKRLQGREQRPSFFVKTCNRLQAFVTRKKGNNNGI